MRDPLAALVLAPVSCNHGRPGLSRDGTIIGMSDPESFLAARLDELERDGEWHVFDCAGMPWSDGDACCSVERDRRRFVAFARSLLAEDIADTESDPGYYRGLGFATWRLLSMWADHPDFDPQWEVAGVTLHKQPHHEDLSP